MATQSTALVSIAPPTVSGVARLDDLAATAVGYANANRSPATLRAYASDWRHFEGWCDTHGLLALPAAPDTVAYYLADHVEAWKVSTLNRRLAVVSVMHQRNGHPSPTISPAVREVAKGIRRQTGAPQRRVAPAVIGDIRRILAHLPDDLLATRDRALILVGFAGALRRSELVALDIDDISDRPEGLAVTLQRSKTDQEGAGRIVAIPYGTETCPVTALRTWTEKAAITTGAVFRSIDRHGNVSPTRLSDRAVALVLKRRAAAAGLDPESYSGHSLRAGFATTAAANGATERAIANQTGHRSMEILRRYIRDGALFTDNGAAALHL